MNECLESEFIVGLIFYFYPGEKDRHPIRFCRVVLGELVSQFVRVAVFSWHIHVHLMSCALICHSIVAVRYIFTH